MATDRNDELLGQILAALGEIRDRLPHPQPAAQPPAVELREPATPPAPAAPSPPADETPKLASVKTASTKQAAAKRAGPRRRT